MRIASVVLSIMAVALFPAASADASCEDQCSYASCDTWCEYCSAPGPYGCTGTSSTTCGEWGTCNPCASVSCNYQPAMPFQNCGIDFDQHVWGTRLELQAGTWMTDANGNSACCPAKYVTRVVARHDCRLVWGDVGSWECCLGWLGYNCHDLIPPRCW